MTFLQGQPVIVVDASVAIELLIGNERWADRLAGWIDAEAVLLVPAHFGVEVANALVRGVGLEEADSIASLGRLWATGIEPADRGLPGLIGAVQLAQRHGLTVYDAAYLDLALDVDAELATLDQRLQTASTAEGLTLAS